MRLNAKLVAGVSDDIKGKLAQWFELALRAMVGR